MATPATAGAAALVRHYFAGGEYAKQVLSSGIDCSASYAAPYCQSYNASGELVKAILVQSAKGLDHWDRGGGSKQYFSDPPDPFQGFGRVTLASALPVGNNNNRTKLFVLDHQSISSTRYTPTFNFTCMCSKN